MNKKIEKIEHELYVAEKRITAAKHSEKALEREMANLTRRERTHRLCTRAGMLEKFLIEPTILTDDDVMEILSFVFHSDMAKRKVQELIAKRKRKKRATARTLSF